MVESALLRYNSGYMIQKKGSALPVRLTADEKAQMAKIAEETGLTSSTLIRLLISSLVSHYRENKNHLTLPLKWRNLVATDAKRCVGGGGNYIKQFAFLYFY